MLHKYVMVFFLLNVSNFLIIIIFSSLFKLICILRIQYYIEPLYSMLQYYCFHLPFLPCENIKQEFNVEVKRKEWRNN